MRVGVDLDNTLVCYDQLFLQLALERNLVPSGTPASKQAIRDYLRGCGQEPQWTALQACAYGERMDDAQPFPEATEFMKACHTAGAEVFVVSHRTKYPYAGGNADLHESARRWLQRYRFCVNGEPPGARQVFLELTKSDKLQRVAELGCDVFIDDLQEILTDPNFPPGVRRILFDPRNENADHPAYRRATSWREVVRLVFGDAAIESAPATGSEVPDQLDAGVRRLLSSIQCEQEFGLVPLAGGANNRAYRVELPDKKLFLKWYFSDPEDRRDRLTAEWGFAQFAWASGLRQLARPLAWDREQRLGLYEFLEGRPLNAGEICRDHVLQAAQFGRELNVHRDTDAARSLPEASEARFSTHQHLEAIGRRVERVVQAAAAGGHPAVQRMVNDRLLPAWHAVSSRLAAATTAHDEGVHAELAWTARILSPSDFGFHNALCDPGGKLRFFDFEYAGWDDPAKTICDFFCQISRPVAIEFWPDFVSHLLAESPTIHLAEQRARLLLPAYRIKWCCIVLNPLLGAGRRRRNFGAGGEATAETPEVWLEKISSLLARLDSLPP